MEMDDKTVLVTGASSGIGLVTAEALAKAGAEVIMVCRTRERGRTARELVAAKATGRSPKLLFADLSVQREVRQLAQEVRDGYTTLDVLINNAGGVFTKRELTIDGVEKTFATNQLAPFLLTNLLLDLLLAAPAGRVVTVATEIYAKRLDMANLQGERRYQFFRAYQASKLCNVLFAFELARKLQKTRATSNVVSPGASKTRFGDDLTGLGRVFTRVMKSLPMFGPAERGAQTVIYAASDAKLARANGRFYFKMQEIETKPVTHDRELAAQLWDVCAELTHLDEALQGQRSPRSRVG